MYIVCVITNYLIKIKPQITFIKKKNFNVHLISNEIHIHVVNPKLPVNMMSIVLTNFKCGLHAKPRLGEVRISG